MLECVGTSMCWYLLVHNGMGWYILVRIETCWCILVRVDACWYMLKVSIDLPLIWSVLTLTVGLISPGSDTQTSSCHTADLYIHSESKQLVVSSHINIVHCNIRKKMAMENNLFFISLTYMQIFELWR